MADDNMADVLKAFASKITTSKVSERKLILGNLAACVAKPDFPEQAVKGVLKHILLTLGCYGDRRSRLLVNNVIEALAKNHFENLLKYFINMVGKTVEQLKTKTSNFDSGLSLIVLDWTCIIMRKGFASADAMKGNSFNSMVQMQAHLLCGTLASTKAVVKLASCRKLERIWKEIKGSETVYCEALKGMESNMYSVCLSCYIFHYLAASKDNSLSAENKEIFLDQYIKHVIGSQTKSPLHILNCAKYLLKHVTHDEFKAKILPAVDRAMLRNPEIVLGAVTHLISGLNLDLSSYSNGLGKHVATQLHSKDDTTRELAATGALALAGQCSDPGAIETLVKLFFAVLNGSEGKLTVTAQRCGMMTGIGNLSYNSVSGANSVQNLAKTVTESFIPILQQEVHEGTLIHILSMLGLWCSKFSTEVPDKLVLFFKTGMGLKTSTPVVRNAYIQCMTSTFHGDTLMQGIDLLPILVQSVEKAANQLTHLQLVTEALSAARLLVRLSQCSIEAENKLSSFWNILMDKDKMVFINDKFLSTASDDALQQLAFLVERLFIEHPQKMVEKMAKHYYRAFVYGLTHGTYHSRKVVQSSAKKMLSGLGGGKIALNLLEQFRNLLATQKVVDRSVQHENMENGDAQEQTKMIHPRILTETLLTLSSLSNADAAEGEAVALHTLEDANHPCIVDYNNSAWTDIMVSLKIDAKEFIETHAEDLLNDIKNSEQQTETQTNMIKNLSRIAPGSMFLELVQISCGKFSISELRTVTFMEYQTMKTPEGELFDKSVLEGGPKGDDKQTNVRRENKLYSYDEQLAELELRKEMEMKRSAKGKKEEPKLSKKQQEDMKLQLQKEADIKKKKVPTATLR